MYIFKKVKDLEAYLTVQRQKGRSIGFAPTMGALHQGHLSLIHQIKDADQLSVCSIFVNPTQFNDPKDLEKYPRPIEKDINLLTLAGCEVLFLPDVEDVYPPDFDHHFMLEFGTLDKYWEGAHRPGHFKGMAQVVKRLLEIVMPDKLFMGQKDFQQFSIVKEMIRQLNLPMQIVCCPIIRETDGLAMSSRNIRLSPEGRIKAVGISAVLFQIEKEHKQGLPLKEIRDNANNAYQQRGIELDYLAFCDSKSLLEIDDFKDVKEVAVLITARIDGVRLLDNVLI